MKRDELRVVRPGNVFGARPEKRVTEPLTALDRLALSTTASLFRRATTFHQFTDIARKIDALAAELNRLDRSAFESYVLSVRSSLRERVISPLTQQRAFAVVSCAIQQQLALRPYREQLYAGWVMLHGNVAEMATGEGKTIAAVFPAATLALAGAPVHVITVNDYLVSRDSAFLRCVYETLGLSVSAVTSDVPLEGRPESYQADIVYCTNKQLVFDYLNDLQQIGTRHVGLSHQLRSLISVLPKPQKLRGLCCAIIDEADSVLVDDARTPLILARLRERNQLEDLTASVALSIARGLHENVDYTHHADKRNLWLTENGVDTIGRKAEILDGVWQFERYRNELVRQALLAIHVYRLDHDYIVHNGRLQLIDNSTGRPLSDRKLQHGLHRMLEIKEKCTTTQDSETLASISYQRFFGRYHHLCGLTGTATDVKRELLCVYGTNVQQIPTHQPSERRHFTTRVAVDRREQFAWFIDTVQELLDAGRAVLVGTRSVQFSEHVSQHLHAHAIEHQLLNARQDSEEAQIIALAGQPGTLTIATNMAGRGTDIALHDEVRAAGGLSVINLEINESRRIDRQLFGRAARQGDPGTSQAILSLADPLLEDYLASGILVRVCHWTRSAPSLGQSIARCLIRYVQWRCEHDNAKLRLNVYHNQTMLKRHLAISGSED